MFEPLWTLLDRVLFGPLSVDHGAPAQRALSVLLRILRYPFALLRDLSRGQINLHAMGLVYTTLLSIVPLIAFTFAILKLFGTHRELEPVIFEFFRPLGADAGPVTAKIMKFAEGVSSGLLGSVGLALLLWTLIGTIQRIENSFNFLWRVQTPRSIGRRVAEYVGLIVLGPLVLVTFIALAHAAIQTEAAQRFANLPVIDQLWAMGLSLAPYGMITAIFTGLYHYIPNTQVRWVPALAGGMVAGILWAAVGKVFTAMVIYTSRLTLVYAGLAVVSAALIWTYLGWLILLVGVQLSFYLQNPNYLRLGLVPLRLSNVEREELAVRMMFLIAKAHHEGARRWTVGGLASRLGLPAIAIADVAGSLESSGLLTQNDQDEFLPGRDSADIRLAEVLDVARNQRAGHLVPKDVVIPEVDGILRASSASWHASVGARTLRDLVASDG
jgi:membrane protein